MNLINKPLIFVSANAKDPTYAMYHCGAVVNPTSISMMKAESALCTADVNQQHHDENGSPGADAAPGCKVQQDMFQGVDAQEEDTAVTSEAGVWPSTELRVALCTRLIKDIETPTPHLRAETFTSKLVA